MVEIIGLYADGKIHKGRVEDIMSTYRLDFEVCNSLLEIKISKTESVFAVEHMLENFKKKKIQKFSFSVLPDKLVLSCISDEEKQILIGSIPYNPKDFKYQPSWVSFYIKTRDWSLQANVFLNFKNIRHGKSYKTQDLSKYNDLIINNNNQR